MIGLITYFSLALVVSFFCSLLEAVILSISPAYINALQHKRPRSSRLLKKLKDNIDRPLSAILTLNTVAHTIGAAGVTFTAVSRVERRQTAALRLETILPRIVAAGVGGPAFGVADVRLSRS